MAYEEHQRASGQIAARCAVITLSDTRSEATDTSGARIKSLLTEQGHSVAAYHVIRDEPVLLEALLDEMLSRDDVDAILTNGGTGVSGRDRTIEVIQLHIQTDLPGFGELFRMLSYEQIGSGAMLSRAVAGIARGKPIFAMPGSTKAVELAMAKLILPELGHLIGELRKNG